METPESRSSDSGVSSFQRYSRTTKMKTPIVDLVDVTAFLAGGDRHVDFFVYKSTKT